MPVAGLVATAVAGPSVFAALTREVVLTGLALAVLLPVVPFALEFLALRRLTTVAFGTLMSLEPAFALVIGLLVLGQRPGWAAVAGIAFVVTAGIGAERTGAREPAPDPGPPPAEPVAREKTPAAHKETPGTGPVPADAAMSAMSARAAEPAPAAEPANAARIPSHRATTP